METHEGRFTGLHGFHSRLGFSDVVTFSGSTARKDLSLGVFQPYVVLL